MFGVNPWTLNGWLGHKAMEETMRYVHVADHHHRNIPTVVERAGGGISDVTARVVAMLSARGEVDGRGNSVATEGDRREETEGIRLVS